MLALPSSVTASSSLWGLAAPAVAVAFYRRLCGVLLAARRAFVILAPEASAEDGAFALGGPVPGATWWSPPGLPSDHPLYSRGSFLVADSLLPAWRAAVASAPDGLLASHPWMRGSVAGATLAPAWRCLLVRAAAGFCHDGPGHPRHPFSVPWVRVPAHAPLGSCPPTLSLVVSPAGGSRPALHSAACPWPGGGG